MKNVILIVVFLISLPLWGQKNLEDVVYLKNGGIIRGIIIEQIRNENIKIQRSDEKIFFVKFDEIEKIVKEALAGETANIAYEKSRGEEKGFINLTEFNYSLGIGSIEYGSYRLKNVDYAFGIRTVNGYQFNEHFTLGIGVGVEKYKNSTLLPLTLDARASLLQGKFSPVVIANGGYSFGLEGVGGLIINPQVGMRGKITDRTSLLFNVGYKMQSQEFSYVEYYTSGAPYYDPLMRTVNGTSTFQFITISAGLSF